MIPAGNHQYTGSISEISAKGGEIREVIPQWAGRSEEYFGAWTPDARYFLFLKGTDRRDIWALRREDSWTRWLRKPEPVQITAGPFSYGRFALSADGKKLFVSGTATRGELQRFDLGSQRLQTILGGLSAECCIYSRDGAWIAYIKFPEGTLWRSRATHIVAIIGEFKGLMVYDASTATWSELVKSPSGGFPLWSRDGKKIYFYGEGSAYRVSLADRKVEKVADLSGIRMASPWFAFSPHGDPLILRDASLNEIYALDLELP